MTFETLANNCVRVSQRLSLFRLFFINIKINSSHTYCLFVCLFCVHIVRLFDYICYHNAQLVPEAQADKTYSVNSEQWGSLSWGTNHL